MSRSSSTTSCFGFIWLKKVKENKSKHRHLNVHLCRREIRSMESDIVDFEVDEIRKIAENVISNSKIVTCMRSLVIANQFVCYCVRVARCAIFPLTSFHIIFFFCSFWFADSNRYSSNGYTTNNIMYSISPQLSESACTVGAQESLVKWKITWWSDNSGWTEGQRISRQATG